MRHESRNPLRLFQGRGEVLGGPYFPKKSRREEKVTMGTGMRMRKRYTTRMTTVSYEWQRKIIWKIIYLLTSDAAKGVVL